VITRGSFAMNTFGGCTGQSGGSYAAACKAGSCGLSLGVDSRVNTATVLGKLLEIENAIFRGDYLAVHSLVMEAEECVLQMEREMLKALRERQGHDRAAS
jgi:hypothetical protein